MSSKKKKAAGKAKKGTAAAKTKARKSTKRPAAAKVKAATRAPVAKRGAKKAAKKSRAVAKKTAKATRPAAKAVAKTAGATKSVGMKRRDGAGHLDPKYAKDLRARSRESRNRDDGDRAFLKNSRSGDSLTEELGEEFVESATSGENEGTEIRDRRVVEEVGGPFTVTSANTEFARGTDRSNPKGATREPFPKS